MFFYPFLEGVEGVFLKNTLPSMLKEDLYKEEEKHGQIHQNMGYSHSSIASSSDLRTLVFNRYTFPIMED